VPARLALVHHANQFLITNGYKDRQGIDRIVEGYAAVLRLHEEHGIVANLHLSGTLIEAAAWHTPWFLDMVKELRAHGLIELIGGVYTESVMTLFSPGINTAQMNELFFLYGEHLDCRPEDVRICWVPERVWDTEKLGRVLTSTQLANGGYRAVLLDDRLIYADVGPGSPRAVFDSGGPFEHGSAERDGDAADAQDPLHPTDAYRPYRISGAKGLTAVPISANVRHWVPPTTLEHWSQLEDTVQSFARDRDDCLLVYADDLERTAGVGGWEESVIDAYDAFLRWVAERDDVVAVSLSAQLAAHPAPKQRPAEPGTFFELANVWGAGDDYGRWSDAVAWAPYRRHLDVAQEDLDAAEKEGADKRLLDLGHKHLFASTYETAWQDLGEFGRAPARWAGAVASHSRACLVITAAARWFAKSDPEPVTRLTDIDRDGEDELVMATADLFAVLAPRRGGRLVYLFARAPDGSALVIGNPTDDWHHQEEMNRHMDAPANHPGALTDASGEDDVYRVSSVRSDRGTLETEMTNLERASLLFGARKTVTLTETHSFVSVCYRLPPTADGVSVGSCLSPDYYRLLREGGGGLMPYDGPRRRGFRLGDVAVWVALAADERTAWENPAQPRVGHGMNVRLHDDDSHFHVLIGSGLVNDGEETPSVCSKTPTGSKMKGTPPHSTGAASRG
jgi:starch synthase